MTDLLKLSKQDLELVDRVTKFKDKPIEEILPESLKPAQVVKYSESAAAILKRNDGERAICLALMGRLHFLARKNRAVLEEAGVSSLREYEDKILGCAEHRSTVFRFSNGYGTFPDETPERLESIGAATLEIAAKAFKDASPLQKQEALRHAEELKSPDKFRKWVENESGVSGPGETRGASLTIKGSAAEMQEIQEWLESQGSTDWAGSDKPAQKIIALIQSAASEIAAHEQAQEPEQAPFAPTVDDAQVEW